jgi:putative transposase
VIVLNERHLLRVLHEYIEHYNRTRPHRSLALDSPDRREPQSKPSATATAVSRPVLGGLHHEYEWAA